MEQKKLQQITKIVQNALKDEREILFCYLFGSIARNDAIGESDVDFAVYLSVEHKAKFFDLRLKLIERLTHALHQQADVVVLNTASLFLKYVVIKEGKLVFARSQEARIDFELKALNEYFDYKPILDQYYKRLQISV